MSNRHKTDKGWQIEFTPAAFGQWQSREAAEQRGELRKRLSSAEVARDQDRAFFYRRLIVVGVRILLRHSALQPLAQAIAELAAAEQRVEEARKVAQRREEEGNRRELTGNKWPICFIAFGTGIADS